MDLAVPLEEEEEDTLELGPVLQPIERDAREMPVRCNAIQRIEYKIGN